MIFFIPALHKILIFRLVTVNHEHLTVEQLINLNQRLFRERESQTVIKLFFLPPESSRLKGESSATQQQSVENL